MTLPRANADLLAQQGLDALRGGDGAKARMIFKRLVAEAPANVPRPWLPLAQACRITGDTAGEVGALQALLRDQPRNIAGLLLMGDRQRVDGDDRAAMVFYTAALNQAAVTREVPTSLHPLLQQAEAFKREASKRFTEHVEAAVSGTMSPRVAQSVDLLLGRRELYLQQPSMFYFAGLPQRPFYAREEFAWTAELEAATRCELRVRADTHEWCDGELVIFDDSFEHEAWNRGKLRV